MMRKLFYRLKPGDTVKLYWGLYQQHVYGKVVRLSDKTKTGHINHVKLEVWLPGNDRSEYKWYRWQDVREVDSEYETHKKRGLVWFDRPTGAIPNQGR